MRSPRRSCLIAIVAAILVCPPAPQAASFPASFPAGPGGLTRSAALAATPPVSVTPLMSGLDIGWDLAFLPNNDMLVTERPGRIRLRTWSGVIRQVTAYLADVYANGESGLMGIVVDPAFSSNHRFYTCQAYQSGGNPVDIRVIRWRLAADETAAVREQTIVSGIPITSGRHAGCRLRFAPDGTLMIGTGDAAIGTSPQNIGSLGGKTLRVRTDGSIPTDNPFYSRGGNARLVWTYGHRNIQGLVVRPWGQTLWSAEHGPDRDDEVNVLIRGRNYGWNPVPGYNEAVPMTDTAEFPTAVPARWSSGSPPLATSGAAFLVGAGWGRWEGHLAVAQLRGEGVAILSFTPDGRLRSQEELPQLDNTYGRIRTVQTGPAGALYVTTSNGGGQDRVLRVSPTSAPPASGPGTDISPSGVAVAVHGNVAYAYVRGTDGLIYHTRQASPGGAWTGFQPIPSRVASAPAAVSDGQHVHLFVRGTNGHLWHSYNTSATTYTRWQDLGGVITTAPGAASRTTGSFDIVARGTDNAVWRISYNRGWSAWRSVGGQVASAPAAAYDPATASVRVLAASGSRLLFELRLSPSGIAAPWRYLGRATYTAPAITKGPSPLVITRNFDGSPVLVRGSAALSEHAVLTGAPAVSYRPGGYVLIGRGSDNALYAQDGRTGAYGWQLVGGRLS